MLLILMRATNVAGRSEFLVIFVVVVVFRFTSTSRTQQVVVLSLAGQPRRRMETLTGRGEHLKSMILNNQNKQNNKLLCEPKIDCNPSEHFNCLRSGSQTVVGSQTDEASGRNN